MHIAAAILGLCSIVVKVLHCPLLPSLSWCRLHHVVLIDPTPHPHKEEDAEYRGIFLVDYVPDVEVTPYVAVKLCIGNSVPGKMRLFTFDSVVKKTEVIRLLQDKISQGDFYEIRRPSQKEPSTYHLYRNNCWRFSRNVTNYLHQFHHEDVGIFKEGSKCQRRPPTYIPKNYCKEFGGIFKCFFRHAGK